MRIRHLKQAVADAQREATFWHEQEPALKKESAKELSASIEIISRSPNAFIQVSQKQKLHRFHEKRFNYYNSFCTVSQIVSCNTSIGWAPSSTTKRSGSDSASWR